MKRSLAAALASVLLLSAAPGLFVVTPARAGSDDHVEARALLRKGVILPLGRILAVANQRVPGDVIDVELEHEDAGWQYKVKVLTPAGKVRKLTLDARTAAVLRIKDD